MLMRLSCTFDHVAVVSLGSSELHPPLKAQSGAGGPESSKTISTQTTGPPDTGMLCLPHQGHTVGIS